MSKIRHKPIYDQRGDNAAEITTLSYDYPPNYSIPEHFHDEAQIVYASSGVMTVFTEEGSWLVPPQRALWIPAGKPHRLKMSGLVQMRTIFLRSNIAADFSKNCCTLNISPLFRELILHICQLSSLHRVIPSELHLLQVLLDQLESAKSLPLQLPYPNDPRAQKLAELLMNNPSNARSLQSLAKDIGTSTRTLERIFEEETSMSFGRWRRTNRLLYALRLLAESNSVSFAALEAGYNSPSAFIAMFKKNLGKTPKGYLDNLA